MAEDHFAAVLSIAAAGQINFAAHQNSIPFLRSLSIRNPGELELKNLVLELGASPNFLTNKRWLIDLIPAGGEAQIKDRKIDLNGGFLKELTEAMTGSACFTLKTGDSVLATETLPIKILAHNEWGGSGTTPELLAAFSLPNDPMIDKLVAKAGAALQGTTYAGLDGYKSGSRKKVWAMISAVWGAVGATKLQYALPPASFETSGQKIRTPSMIAEGGVATCLDTTLLFCSILEQIQLNPIVVMLKGHAFAGVWLQPDQFSQTITDDVAALRKRIDLDEILVFETTYVTNLPLPTLMSAAARAKDQLKPEATEFIHAVDIKRARLENIAPLGQTIKREIEHQLSADGTTAIEIPPELPDFDTKPEDKDLGSLSPKDRLEAWQRRLLDLSARNPLLNYRSSASSIKLLCHAPDKLEDMIAGGKQVRIKQLPTLDSARDDEIYRESHKAELEEQVVEQGLDKGEVYAHIKKTELDTALVTIYRKAKSDLEEGGSNTLFVAIGFLIWCKDGNKGKPYRAPLLLVPVELKRASARTPPVLVAHDDETKFNPTLLQMLRQDFEITLPGLDNALPRDESGTDVRKILTAVRNAVKDIDGFDVTEDVVLGTFSFAKYLMWKDLVDRTAQLRGNNVVKHLLDTPRDTYSDGGSFPDVSSLDEIAAPREIFAPLDYDSSQLAAVIASSDGRDFVLFGPPGTGKSQSIANIISHNMAKRRKVLFVAEKRAALDVVYRRLQRLGLGEFCLELHSNKAKKRSVLDQLNRAWMTGSSRNHAEWEIAADKLKDARDHLNRYVAELHKPRHNGLSIYAAIGVRTAYGYLPEITFEFPNTDVHTSDDLEKLRAAVNELEIQAKVVGQLRDHPLTVVAIGEWSNTWRASLIENARKLMTESAHTRSQLGLAAKSVGMRAEQILSRARLRALAELADAMTKPNAQHAVWCLGEGAPKLIEDIGTAIRLLDEYRQTERRLSVGYHPEPWRSLDLDQLKKQWQEGITGWWPKTALRRRGVIKGLRRLGGANGTPAPAEDITCLDQMQQAGAKIDAISEKLINIVAWKGTTTDLAVISDLISTAQELRAVTARLADTSEEIGAIRAAVAALLTASPEIPTGESSVARQLVGYSVALRRLEVTVGAFDAASGTILDSVVPADGDFLDCARAVAARVIEYEDLLNRWCAWIRARNEAKTLGLNKFIAAVEEGAIPVGSFKAAFEAAYCGWWAARKIDEIPTLRLFAASSHNDRVRLFRELDDQVQTLTADYVKALICADIPARDDLKDKPDFAVLHREIQKGSRNMPVRELFTKAQEILPALAPCVLMSPMSVAQYLPADLKLFDIVIFDEASQIAVWDAVGAIARGKQVIVCGDPKQMPPTNFFARSPDAQVDDSDLEEDLESILDEMIAAGIPSMALTWHYRSRSEGLIAFSNSRYYEGSLITFPAPVTNDRSVRLQFVPNGVYQRGKEQTNPTEARAIVDRVVALLRSSEFADCKRSLGIVSFNVKQQTLIENLLDQARKENPDIEPHFSDQAPEPVFIKNLESVQGDERDVILFSVTFGKDETGAMTMNFGPLNQEGGWRRLNVAVTRARIEMVVFSTIKAEHIDLSRTGAQGVVGLKEFLDYAERGVVALGVGAGKPRGDYDSPFEFSVANALRDKGWTVHSQVGVGPFRIDLAIVHPEKPGRYLAAVECDGATYHRSATARDRDKVRENILRGLGWEILRIWSTDYWFNASLAINAVDTELHTLCANEARVQEAATKTAIDLDADKSERDASIHLFPKETTEAEETLGAEPDPEDTTPSSEPERFIAGRIVSPVAPARYHLTQREDIEGSGISIDPDGFYDSRYKKTLVTIVSKIVETEAPIQLGNLVDRVARLHGFQRSGPVIFDRVRTAARAAAKSTRDGGAIFLWRKDSDPDSYAMARLPQSDVERRAPHEICIQELAAILQLHRSEDDPIIAAARSLRIHRLTGTARARMEKAWESLIV